MNFGSAVDLLAGLRSGCEDTTDPFYWAMNLNVSFTGRVDPAVIYYQRVLHLWTNAFGGKLGISRNSRIDGPLVRYFLAVAHPVMGQKMPSLESMPDIVRRQKRYHAWFMSHYGRCDWVWGSEE